MPRNILLSQNLPQCRFAFTGSVAVILQTTTTGPRFTTAPLARRQRSPPRYIPARSRSPTVRYQMLKALKPGSNPSSQAIATFTIVTPAPQITLTWQDNSNNENNFSVERKTGTGAYAQIALAGINVVSYLDTSVTRGVTYCYRIRAIN